jgi:Fe2+ or Zn2+ uptake regulation protein
MQTTAQHYEHLLGQLHFRPHPLRMHILQELTASAEFTDVRELCERMKAAGVDAHKEKVRMIIKRLNECGFLERQQIPGKNKFLFRLKNYAQLEAEVGSKMQNQHQ